MTEVQRLPKSDKDINLIQELNTQGFPTNDQNLKKLLSPLLIMCVIFYHA